MTELREGLARAGHAAVQKLLAEYDADHDRPVSQAECNRVFADAAIAYLWPLAMEHAAGVADHFLMTQTSLPVEKVVDCKAAIRSQEMPK